jgi:Putative DNA-binding domain
MAITRSDFAQISEADLLELIDTGVPEGQTIEYKSAPYGKTDADKREFLKDVTAFANTKGGHLVIGMRANDGVASQLVPITEAIDEEKLRMEQLLQSGIEPRLYSIEIGEVIADGGKVLVLRIPKSWNAPHRVTAQNSNRFYARNSAGVYEPSTQELREMFNAASELSRRIEEFRNNRLKELSKIGLPIPKLNEQASLVMHIVPYSSFSASQGIDLRAIRNYGNGFSPMGGSSTSHRYNFHGLVRFRVGPISHGYTQVFRTGAVEATKFDISTEQSAPPFIRLVVCNQIIEGMDSYLGELKYLGVQCPITIMLTFQNVAGKFLGSNSGQGEHGDEITESNLSLPPCTIEEYPAKLEIARILRPAFDAFWNAAGYESCPHYDQNGNWILNLR